MCGCVRVDQGSSPKRPHLSSQFNASSSISGVLCFFLSVTFVLFCPACLAAVAAAADAAAADLGVERPAEEAEA